MHHIFVGTVSTVQKRKAMHRLNLCLQKEGIKKGRGVAQFGLERTVRDREVGRSNRLAPIWRFRS